MIGNNGAGKTTLFRLLSSISLPTRGRVRIEGRVSSLIALGAGFHPDLSGRENLYLNCALMGLSRRQTAGRIDQIVAFAELDAALDLPIKQYSSGMLARLGFSVAVHLDPELILVDEVLAVGDYRFQVKSTAALRDFIARGDGNPGIARYGRSRADLSSCDLAGTRRGTYGWRILGGDFALYRVRAGRIGSRRQRER